MFYIQVNFIERLSKLTCAVSDTKLILSLYALCLVSIFHRIDVLETNFFYYNWVTSLAEKCNFIFTNFNLCYY